MAYEKVNLTSNGEVLHYPSPHDAFAEIMLTIPELHGRDEVRGFARECRETVRRSCVRAMCTGEMTLSTTSAGDELIPDMQLVKDAHIECYQSGCPLDPPDKGGDREPRNPAPHMPGLQAEAEVPVSIMA